jgi:soluble lytic murein transglycosylase
MLSRELVRTLRVPASALMAIAAAVHTPAAPPDSLSGELKSAVSAAQSQHSAASIAALKSLSKRIPKLADYIAWFQASAEFDSENYADVPKTIEAIWTQSPPSPLVGRAALLGAQALLKINKPGLAVDMLRKNYVALAQPQGDLAMAKAFVAAGDAVSASVYAQRVYYGYPTSSEAVDAEALSSQLQTQLGDRYPPAMGNAMLSRAIKLMEAGQPQRARRELVALLPQLGGADRDLAQVKIGVADFNSREMRAARRYFAELTVQSPEADAERLYYLTLCARRDNDRDAMNGALDELARKYPNSNWRLEALIAAANSYLLENRVDSYEPLFRACYESFPASPKAATCHWKVTWAHYLKRDPDSANRLREHLRLFPASDQASAALYFLGRIAESSNDLASARAYYDEIIREYPNFFYAGLARSRIRDWNDSAAAVPVAATSSPAAEFLRTVSFPARARVRSFEPDATAKLRIERARLLSEAGLDDWAEVELRYAAQNEDRPQLMGLELARMANRRSAPDQAIRYLKRYLPDYLYMPLDSAPEQFWKLAFPIPYRADLERYARQNDLDPFLLAALARQESEFNPKATSPANARGLTQILPSTGRQLSRQLRVPYTAARLFQPKLNLQLGAYYLKSISDQVGGRWEAALAAYNAGLSRVNNWSSWGEFREPAEFVETIPFTQTREYIQIILRNAEIYRRLYGAASAPAMQMAETSKPASGGPARLSYSDGIDQRRKSSRATGAR